MLFFFFFHLKLPIVYDYFLAISDMAMKLFTVGTLRIIFKWWNRQNGCVSFIKPLVLESTLWCARWRVKVD